MLEEALSDLAFQTEGALAVKGPVAPIQSLVLGVKRELASANLEE